MDLSDRTFAVFSQTQPVSSTLGVRPLFEQVPVWWVFPLTDIQGRSETSVA